MSIHQSVASPVLAPFPSIKQDTDQSPIFKLESIPISPLLPGDDELDPFGFFDVEPQQVIPPINSGIVGRHSASPLLAGDPDSVFPFSLASPSLSFEDPSPSTLMEPPPAPIAPLQPIETPLDRISRERSTSLIQMRQRKPKPFIPSSSYSPARMGPFSPSLTMGPSRSLPERLPMPLSVPLSPGITLPPPQHQGTHFPGDCGPRTRSLLIQGLPSVATHQFMLSWARQFGDVRHLWRHPFATFAVISWFDLRAALGASRAARDALYEPLFILLLPNYLHDVQSMPGLYQVAMENISATLVVFSLSPEVADVELRAAFHDYGEVVEIRRTPKKEFHRFIEFFDVRAAMEVLCNPIVLHGKTLKLEASKPGGKRSTQARQMERFFLNQIKELSTLSSPRPLQIQPQSRVVRWQH